MRAGRRRNAGWAEVDASFICIPTGRHRYPAVPREYIAEVPRGLGAARSLCASDANVSVWRAKRLAVWWPGSGTPAGSLCISSTTLRCCYLGSPATRYSLQPLVFDRCCWQRE